MIKKGEIGLIRNYNNWNSQKQKYHFDKQRPFFHEQEVWFCSLGINIGFEQNGKGSSFLRPVLILKKFNNKIFWGIPLTKNQKEGLFYFQTNLNGKFISTLLLSQLRLFDSKRLIYKTGNINSNDFNIIKEKIRQFLPDSFYPRPNEGGPKRSFVNT